MSRPLSLLVVLLVVAATLHGALFGGLVYDDLRVIAGNSAIDHPASWRATLAEPLWGPTFPHWRPLTQLLLALAYSSGGATAVHALALALHLGAVGIAWRIAHQLLEPRAAALVALAFGVHAVQAESVAWAAALNDPLWGLGALLAIDAHWRAGPQRMAPAAVLGLALALAAKETGILVAGLLVAIDLWRWRDSATAPRWLRLWPCAVVLALWFGARVLVFGDLAAGFDRGPGLELAVSRARLLPLELLGRHAALLLWPWPASMFRPMPVTSAAFAFVAAGLALLGLTAWSIWRRARLASLGLSLLLVALAPYALRPASLGEYPVADRYLYFAVFAALLAGGELWAHRAGFAALAVATLAWAVGSAVRVYDFADQATFVAAHRARGDDARVIYMAAQVALEAAPPRLDEARAEFTRAAALAVAPRFGDEDGRVRLVADIEAGLAWCEFVAAAAQPRADWLKVADRFVQILRKHADHAPSHAGYGVCLAQLGDLDGAELHLRRAVELEPAMISARANLQRVLAMRGR